MSVAQEALPDLYRRWLASAFGDSPPRELQADCSDCPMCGTHSAPRELNKFAADAKCCTYMPTLPNFLVGAIITDARTDPRGAESVKERIGHGVAVTPLGIGASPLYKLSYEAVREKAVFGRAASLRCPHYLDERGGRCGIWNHRNAVCSTWFCKFNRGAIGSHMWQETRTLLTQVERTLALWVCRELEFDEDTLRQLIAYRSLEVADSLATEFLGHWSSYSKQLWGHWYGREEEFYVAADSAIKDLEWADVRQIGGVEVQIIQALAARSYELAVSPSNLLEYIYAAKVEIHSVAGTRVLKTFSAYDALQLTAPVSTVLEETKSIRRTRDLLEAGIDESLILTLLDREVLIGSAHTTRHPEGEK